MADWQSIETAPTDGTWFVGRRGHLERPTQWGKTSHVPLYGWCYIASQVGDGEPDYDLWRPLYWTPLTTPILCGEKP